MYKERLKGGSGNGRNEAMFAFATFERKRKGSVTMKDLKHYNETFGDPLQHNELQTILNQVKNPKYKDVVKNTTGHYETLEITYDSSITNFEKLLEIFWINIDPFDANGQFCDKGESFKSVVFYENNNQKKIIETSIKKIENKFNKVVGLLGLEPRLF